MTTKIQNNLNSYADTNNDNGLDFFKWAKYMQGILFIVYAPHFVGL